MASCRTQESKKKASINCMFKNGRKKKAGGEEEREIRPSLLILDLKDGRL